MVSTPRCGTYNTEETWARLPDATIFPLRASSCMPADEYILFSAAQEGGHSKQLYPPVPPSSCAYTPERGMSGIVCVCQNLHEPYWCKSAVCSASGLSTNTQSFSLISGAHLLRAARLLGETAGWARLLAGRDCWEIAIRPNLAPIAYRAPPPAPHCS